MKKVISFLILFTIGTFPLLCQNVVDYVDPFICTAGDHGQLDPSVTVPFGMIKLGPDTEPGNHSGYDFNASKIKGFSHNRFGGVGCNGAGGDLRILPLIGDTQTESVEFIKESEIAYPGYYKVDFTNKIKAELTATNQTGIHKYTFPESDSAIISMDIGSSFDKLIQSKRTNLNKQEFFATISAQNVCGRGRYTSHYFICISKECKQITREKEKLYFQFHTEENEEIYIYVTSSPISTKDARKQWESSKALSFKEVVNSCKTQWEQLLSRIIVEGKEEYKTLFYTHLYHMLLNPVKTNNPDYEFRATDGRVYKSPEQEHYDGWSMWDNFRNKFSLISIIAPQISNDIANSLVDLYKYGKSDWSGKHEPVPTVRTEHSIITLLDLYRRDITNFDITSIYEKMVAEVEKIIADSPDKILEKSYDYWALSQFADILGKDGDYNKFQEKVSGYKSTWEKYFLPITEKSDVMHGDGIYEGTLWQYRWHVQFDIDGMIKMIGSKEKYTDQLEYFFDNNLYNHGNQPDIHAPFMFNFGTKPWLTQKWVNKILTKEMVQYYGTHGKWDEPSVGRIYKAEPEGYIPEMDDDDGTMSAWYVLSSMGLYPVEVGKPIFQISSPVFDKVKIKLGENKVFEIITNGLSENNIYIRSATLNGQPFNQSYINQSDIIKGGKLVFQLSDIPNPGWGIK